MRNWKREHHFIDYRPLIKESDYQYEGDILKHTFETNTHISIILAAQLIIMNV